MFPLPMQNVYMFMEVFFPDTIYVSVILRVELIFSEDSLFLLIFKAGMKRRQK